MEHFFYDDNFCSDIEDLARVFDIDEDNVNELKDDWQVKVELSDLEPIFKVDADNICQLLADANEDRLSEDFDEEAKVLKALSVNHWNDIRESLKGELSVSELAQIDGSGFIKSVKKQNNWVSE